MEYTLEKGSWENISDAVQVEEETLPNSCYLRDNSAYFLNDTVGDLTMVRAGDEPVGIGKLSVLPDGSGWLETLRVRPAWQGRGVGKAIYARWLEEAQSLECPAIRMFTGTGNVRSRGLAERFGLSLAGTYIGATANLLTQEYCVPQGFEPVRDFHFRPGAAGKRTMGNGRFCSDEQYLFPLWRGYLALPVGAGNGLCRRAIQFCGYWGPDAAAKGITCGYVRRRWRPLPEVCQSVHPAAGAAGGGGILSSPK